MPDRDDSPPLMDAIASLRARVKELELSEARHHAELTALRESEQRYRSLIEEAQDGFFVADLHGKCIGSNAALRGMLGYEEDELARKFIDDLIAPEDLAQTPLRSRELRSGVKLATRRALVRKDGSRVVTEIAASLLPGGRFEAVVRDVSERLKAEEERTQLTEELRHAQKMESIGRLAGGLAHDFNNLLLVILANSHVLRRRCGALVANELDAIVAAAERGGTLTRQLLSFSRKRVLKPTTIDLNDVVRGMQGILAPLMGGTISVSFELSAEPCRLLADGGQLEQVIMNLMVNARDACASGGSVRLRTELVEAVPRGVHEPGAATREVVLRVEDSGRGMDADTLAHMFEPFFTTKGVGEGTGLGLSMVYGIVTQSGGNVSAKSKPGEGARFEVRLPAAPPTAAGESGRSDAREPERVGLLIVEDDRAVRLTLDRTLTAAGFKVLVASSAEEALELHRARASEVELVITDVVMPGLTGAQLAEQLLAERPTLPILLVSGYSEKLFAEGLGDDRLSFLQKPFTPDELVTRLREMLRARRG